MRRASWAAWTVVLACFLSAAPAGAQDPGATTVDPVPSAPQEPPASDTPAVDQAGPATEEAATAAAAARAVRDLVPAETEVLVDLRTRVTAGLTFGGPLGAAATVGLLHGLGADVREDGEQVKAVCAVPLPHCARGFLLEAAAGSGGGKLSLGLGAHTSVKTEDFRGDFGLGLKLSLARTWGSPLGTEPGLTYLGPELDLVAWRVALGLGVLFRVDGDGGKSALFTWGLGLRL